MSMYFRTRRVLSTRFVWFSERFLTQTGRDRVVKRQVVQSITKMSRFEDRKDVTGTAFRKIDIDEYSENRFQEEETDGGAIGPPGPDENEVLQLLSQGKNAEALISVLKSAPLGSKNQQTKDNARNLTQKVLLSIKTNQMDDCLAQLDKDLVDVLMKYIYRGFEIPTKDSSAHLLAWHEKVYNINGMGSIMRVLADSKRA